MLASAFLETIVSIPQLPIILGCLVPIVAIVVSFSHKTHVARSDNDLKRSMVERGMSADEIERVLAAKSSHADHGKHH